MDNHRWAVDSLDRLEAQLGHTRNVVKALTPSTPYFDTHAEIARMLEELTSPVTTFYKLQNEIVRNMSYLSKLLPSSIDVASRIGPIPSLSDLIRVPHPPRAPVVQAAPEIIEDEVIGDDSSITQVDNGSLPDTYEFRFPSLSVPLKIDDPDCLTQPMHYLVLNQVEQQLRRIVEERLSLLYGSQWIKRCVPDQLIRRWVKQRRRDPQAHRPLIQYSGFPDLRVIITEPDNWHAFEPIFGNRDEIGVSLRRLHPVRNSIAHSRPLNEDQGMTLVYEARWILIRIGHRNVI